MSPFNETRDREIARETCLRAFAGRDAIMSCVFDATELVADSDGRFILPIGTPLSRSGSDPTKVKPYAAGGTDTDAVQEIEVSGSPTGGTFTLTFQGQTTAAIPYNATAGQVDTALEALDVIGTSGVASSGGSLPGTAVSVTFGGPNANQALPEMTADYSGLTGGTNPAVTVTTTTEGESVEAVLGIFDGPDRDYFGDTVADQEPIPVYFHSCVFDVSKIKGWGTNSAAIKSGLPTCDFY